jgi:hypothetical protein
MEVGPAGATLETTDLSVVIPPGALSVATAVGVRTVDKDFPPLPPAMGTPVVYELTPHGTSFAVPVSLRFRISHAPGDGPIVAMTAAPGGMWTPLEGILEHEQSIEVRVSHFSNFVVGQLAGGVPFEDVCGNTCPADAHAEAHICTKESSAACGLCGDTTPPNATECVGNCGDYIATCGFTCPDGWQPAGPPYFGQDPRRCVLGCGAGCNSLLSGPPPLTGIVCERASGTPLPDVCKTGFTADMNGPMTVPPPRTPGMTGPAVGTYDLTGLGSRCDTYAAGGGFNEGGTFTARSIDGWLTLSNDGVVRHAFAITGTCTLPNGTQQEVGGIRPDQGTYQVQGSDQVQITHHGVPCTGSFAGAQFSIVTGTLFPPVRFWYTLQKRRF